MWGNLIITDSEIQINDINNITAYKNSSPVMRKANVPNGMELPSKVILPYI